ncbi:MAG: hypothetical protein H0S79_21065, partial [Anaerolineaceae bacterium]|nr:hypothetical protein [Anaerolineaceae bacterium]
AALTVLGVGVAYVAVLLIFYFVNISFISNDSLYLILMGKDLIQSGFAEWYFASPGWTGPYIPMIQTIGMLFDADYVWFIQPVLSLIFIAAFLYLTYQSVSRFISKKWAAIALVLGGLLMFLSADLPFVMLFYIHTNFSSGIFLFLAVLGLVFAIEEENDGYLLLSLIALISFGLLRIENVIVALTVILFTLATGKLTRKQSAKTFLPYLLIQGIWLLAVYFMDIESYLDSLSKEQILLMAGASLAMMIVVLLSQWRFLKTILALAGKIVPYLFMAGWAFLGLQDPAALVKNIRSVATNLFISGNWGIFWWVICALALISLLRSQFPQKKMMVRIIVSFLMIVQILGFFRAAYHARWYDSANRMMIH